MARQPKKTGLGKKDVKMIWQLHSIDFNPHMMGYPGYGGRVATTDYVYKMRNLGEMKQGRECH